MIEDRFLVRLEQLVADGKRRILGLVGAPGAGKSTLAEAILEALPGRAVVVPMDGFHLANIELERLGRASRKGAEDTFDSAGYVALLARLRAQRHDEMIYAPMFRREIEEPIAGAIPVMPDVPLVITEGNYLLLQQGEWKAVRPLLDEAWFVDVDQELRVQRLIARHVQFGRDEDAAREWVQRSDEVNAALINTTRGQADMVFQF
ncbi:nucleoside/nucleotide kinase family protein [Caballeronia sp. 15711]|uniref:nucleoside/nucleotide kinase family protein n=1 Tax=unclassified Caballeronia TaxID=2646786 RepID=UPI0039E5F8DB